MKVHSKEFYPGVPVVYCGVNNLNIDILKDLPHFFGYDEKVDYAATLKSIQKIFPERKNVLIINDSTITGNAIRAELMNVLPEFDNQLNFEFFSDFDIEELQSKIVSLDDTYAIYLLVINRDKNGRFISYTKGISAIYKVSDLPIFGSWDFYEKKGLFGGKITRGFDQGQNAAELTEEIIKNGITNQISQFNNVVNKYIFDYQEMDRFGVSEEQIPLNSLVINKPDTDEDLLQGILFLSAIFLTIIIFLLVRLVLKKRSARILKRLVDEKTVRLREMNVVLKESIVKKDRFLSIMSHDLKGPFNSMLGFSELLYNDYDEIEKDQQKKYIGIIYQGLEHTFKLLEDILSWSYTQSGKIEYNPKIENVFILIKEVLEVLNFSANQKSIGIIINVPESIYVRADTNMLSTILRNLIFNAIKYTPRKGQIEISVQEILDDKNQKYAEFSVKDNGIGISRDILSNLFDIGEISSTNGTDNETGTGLGLILCKEFTDKHKGQIWVESEETKGSRFVFTIPMD